jgi:hypothetical protein
MDDRRVALLRARAAAHRSEAALQAAEVARKATEADAALAAESTRLEAEADATLAVRAAGESPWGSGLPKELLELVLEKVLELLQWEPSVCGAIRATCSTWCGVHDALLPRLRPRGSLAMMAGKLSWFAHVTEVDLTRCLVDSTFAWTSWSHSVPGPLAELGSMPSLSLPESCTESAVDAEAVYGLTMLTTLHFCREVQRVEVGEMVLDLSRLTSLTSLNLENCFTMTTKEVQALSSLTALTNPEPLAASELCRERGGRRGGVWSHQLHFYPEYDEDFIPAEDVGEWVLDLSRLTSLNLQDCFAVTDEEVQALSSLTALATLHLWGCHNLTAEAKQALRAAIPNLTIRGRGLSHHRTELLPPHPSAHVPQCDGVQRLAWRAA